MDTRQKKDEEKVQFGWVGSEICNWWLSTRLHYAVTGEWMAEDLVSSHDTIIIT